MTHICSPTEEPGSSYFTVFFENLLILSQDVWTKAFLLRTRSQYGNTKRTDIDAQITDGDTVKTASSCSTSRLWSTNTHNMLSLLTTPPQVFTQQHCSCHTAQTFYSEGAPTSLSRTNENKRPPVYYHRWLFPFIHLWWALLFISQSELEYEESSGFVLSFISVWSILTGNFHVITLIKCIKV